MNDIPDLIPDRFGGPATRSPFSILQHQAARFAERTQGLGEGIVSTSMRRMDLNGRAVDALTIDLFLVAPSLGGYRRHVLELGHDILAHYPLVVASDVPGRNTETLCANEAQLIEALRMFFWSDDFQRLVAAICNAAESAAENPLAAA